MRNWLPIPLMLALSGCISLGAKPHEFTCNNLLENPKYAERLPDTALTAAIQRDAGSDEPGASGPRALTGLEDGRSSLIGAALTEIPVGLVRDARPPTALLLSGGGQWGAFGAGFIAQLQQGADPIRIDVVTGISTGAIQGLFVAAEDWEDLAEEYTRKTQEEVATYSPFSGILRRGSLYDTTALRERIYNRLCPDEQCSGTLQIAHPDRPHLLVGMVKLADADLYVVDVTGIIRAAYEPGSAISAAQAAECATGVVMASASVPVQLTPVRIDNEAYADGGVRASVLAVALGQSARFENLRARLANGGVDSAPIELYVIRNGPTVVFPPAPAKNGSTLTRIDELPNVPNVGLRAYRTIVNQTEVASIAQLRAIYSAAPIRVMTADGYISMSPRPCPRPEGEDRAFDPDFMQCLIEFGRFKATQGATPPKAPDWIVLPDAREDARAAMPTTLGAR